MKKTSLAIGLSMVILVSCKKDVNENATPEFDPSAAVENFFEKSGIPAGSYVPNELLIKFKKGTSQTGRSSALARVNGTVTEQILTRAMQQSGDAGVYLVKTSLEVKEAISRLKGQPDVEYAEPNFIYTHDATSNDPYYTNNYLWGMYGETTSPKNVYGSRAGEAWAKGNIGSTSTTPPIVVGIIDEGVMHGHEDLSANIWKNPGELGKTSGVDDDGNGYVDDIYGWDFNGNNNTTYDGTGDDHGTHVAGTIGGVGGNGKGVAGVCWNVKMITAKFLGPNGGTTSNAIKSIDYLTDLKRRHNLDLVATNNSWGGGGFSQALKDAIDRSGAANILFIAAAGNGGGDGIGDNNDVTPSYPASYVSDNIIAVASITSSGAKSGFSNFGATSVDLGAPGSGIYSTVPGNGGKSAYKSYSGTSMATPHVTGGAALRAASLSDRGIALKNAILDAARATYTPSLDGKTVTNGRLNVSGF